MIIYIKILSITSFADEVRAALNREAGERPALSRSCHAELPPIRHWATGKAGRGDDAEPEELPDRNAASPLRETGRRDQSLDLCAFLRFFAKRLFICAGAGRP